MSLFTVLYRPVYLPLNAKGIDMSKEEIQSFIIWFLPAVAISYFVSGVLLFSETGGISFGHRLDFLVRHLSTIICGVWLFVRSPKHGLNKWLWGLFGLGAHLFAIVLYFGYVAFNQAIKRNA